MSSSGKNIEIGQSLAFGWKTFKSNVGFFIALYAIIIGLELVIGLLSAGFLNSIVQLIVNLGVIHIMIAFARGQKPELVDMFKQYRLFFYYLGAAILYGLIVLGGLILFIVPGIYWALKFAVFSYAIVDQKKGPIAALKESARLTDGVKWDLLGFIIVSALLNLLGALALGAGLFVTIPVVSVAMAYIYVSLLGQTSQPQPLAQVKTPSAQPPPAPAPASHP